MKTINAVAETVETKTKSKETSMKTKAKDMFTKMAEKNPKLAKAIKSIKKGSVYLVKNYLSNLAIVATFPALIVGGVGVIAVCKYKGGKYLTNKKAVYSALGVTAAVAVTSVVTIVAAGAVTGLLVAAAVTTAICVAVDAWSWFKNRKAK